MADLAQIEAALVKADAAGDVEGARVLAGEVRRMRSQPTAPQQPTGPAPTAFTPSGERSAFRDAMGQFDEALKAITNLNPQTALFRATGEGMKSATDLIEKGAYHVGGAVTDATGSPLAGYATNVGVQAIPTVIGAVAGDLMKRPLRQAAEVTMQSALKPDAAARVKGFGGAPSDAEVARRVMLDRGINATEGGVAKLRGLVSSGKTNINNVVSAADAAGTTVPKTAMVASRPGVEARFTEQFNAAKRTEDLAKIESRYLDWLTDPSIPDRIPVGKLQALKEGQQSILKVGNKYGQQTNMVDVAVDKAMGKDARVALEQAIPGIKQLNKTEQELIKTLAVADKRAALAQNKDIVGPFPLLASNPKAFAAMTLDRSSAFKSILARMINASHKGSVVGGAAAGAAVGYEGAQAP